jgi:hypothetical protein
MLTYAFTLLEPSDILSAAQVGVGARGGLLLRAGYVFDVARSPCIRRVGLQGVGGARGVQRTVELPL